jgi:CheY-like chemotaxis protein
MYKLLVISKSRLVSDFFTHVCSRYRMEVIRSSSLTAGMLTLHYKHPDCIISDIDIYFEDTEQYQKESVRDRAFATVPLLLLVSRLPRETAQAEEIRKKSSHNTLIVKKPLAIDEVLDSLASVLKLPLPIDKTPCVVDIHLNDDFFFIEIDKGLNRNKLDMVQFKLRELTSLYALVVPRILLIIKPFPIPPEERETLTKLVTDIYNFIQTAFPHVTDPSDALAIVTGNEDIIRPTLNTPLIKRSKTTDNIIDAVQHVKKSPLPHGKLVGGEATEKSNQEQRLEELQMKFSADSEDQPVIAIVDDDKAVLEFMKGVFEDLNTSIKTYKNGMDFIGDLSNSIPDLLFLDLKMPGMNGIEVVKTLKELHVLRQTYVCVFSAVLNSNIINTLKGMGIVDFVTKTHDDITNIVYKVYEIVQKLQNHGHHQHFETQKSDHGMQVAVVDDDMVIREYMKLVLEKHNWQISTYENGQDFVNRFDDKKPDLVFLDLLMPIMDGFAVLDWLRENDHSTPVIVFSALSQHETVEKAIAYGIKDYIIKPPPSFDVILKKAEEILAPIF